MKRILSTIIIIIDVNGEYLQSLRTLWRVFSVRESYLISDTISIDNLSFNNLVEANI